MKTCTRKTLRKAFKLSALAGLGMSLSGCIVALPPAIQLASLALDGISYVSTGKSVTDHAISAVTAKDCAMIRSLKGENICDDKVIEVAMLPDGTPVPNADDAASNIKTGAQDTEFQEFSEQQHVSGIEDADEVLDMTDQAADELDMATASGPML